MTLSETVTIVSIAVVVYAYFGYPLVLLLLRRLLSRPVEPGETNAMLSLILPLHNEAGVVARRVDNLRASIPVDRSYEILLVNDGSSDSTLKEAEALADDTVRVINQTPRQGKCAAINRAVSEAHGEILIFTDAHARFDNNTLAMLQRHFNDPQVGAVTGEALVEATKGIGGGENLYWTYEAWLKESESAIHSSCAVTGAVVAMRRSAFRPIPEGIINDDAWMNLDIMSQGLRFLHDEDAKCVRAPSMTLRDDRKRRRRIAAGRYQLLFRPSIWPWRIPAMLFCYTSHKFLRLLLGIPMLGALLANIIAVFTGSGPVFVLLLIAQGVFYGLALASTLSMRLPGKLSVLGKAAAFLVNVNLGDLGGLFQYLSGRNSTLWAKTNKAS